MSESTSQPTGAEPPQPTGAQPPAAEPTPPVLLERDGAVAIVTLARPEAMNALDLAVKNALRDALAELAEDPQVRAVVLTGSGRAFCVGQDLKEHVALIRDGQLDRITATVPEHFVPIAATLAGMPKPVVAAVNGVAAGAGASMAFACDFRIVADTAGFNTAFAGIGLSADTGASWTLPRLVGWAKARELLMLPRTIPAAEAATLGLATEVVPAGTELPRARELAAALASGPTVAFGAIKRALAFSATNSLEDSLCFEAEMMALTFGSQDHHDAVEAFVAKRKPGFSGR